jgi:hypothetical protein
MVKISMQRAVDNRRSKSEMGMERVAVEPLLGTVDTVSRDILSLLSPEVPLPLVELLPLLGAGSALLAG